MFRFFLNQTKKNYSKPFFYNNSLFHHQKELFKGRTFITMSTTNTNQSKPVTEKKKEHLNKQNLYKTTDSPLAVKKDVPEGFDTVAEGSARIIFKKGKDHQVFYNPVQMTNRDLSLLCIEEVLSNIDPRDELKSNRKANKKYGKKANRGYADLVKNEGGRICEALAATGLRSVRYAKELPSHLVREIVCNDIDPEAVESIKRNVEFNDIKPGLITPSENDALTLLYSNRDHF